jgi:hypothetical protein
METDRRESQQHDCQRPTSEYGNRIRGFIAPHRLMPKLMSDPRRGFVTHPIASTVRIREAG